ncbi:MAG: patatin-like phospholipase family protein [Myxococcales bacterium]|nr:patatin-like phospholipase family protein [Myxococcales bacterium]
MTTSAGIVLAGAAALGAYEAGVLCHVLGAVARDIGRPRVFDIVSGTSAGAINAAAIAAFADDPAVGAARACDAWSGLRLGQVLRPSALEIVRYALEATDVTSRLARALKTGRARGGLLDPRPIAKLLEDVLPIERIEAHLTSGVLGAVAISATHVASGRSTVFYRSARPLPPWQGEGGIAVPATLTREHVMASAAIPLLFPPVTVDGDLYCDGGLRQLVPMSPSIHLGARRLLVINPLAPVGSAQDEQARREASSSPLYLAGKALNALFVDRTEADLARLEHLSAVLRAGRHRYGPAFEADLNAELARGGHAPLHEVAALRIEPSADLARLAAEYAGGGELARRERGVVASVMRCLAEAGATRSGDLLSYLLFDGGFATELIALGKADARRQHEELCALFDGAVTRPRSSTATAC